MKQAGQSKKGNLTLVAAGSNATSAFGSPLKTVQAALREIENRWGCSTISRFYQTPAFPAGAGPDFVNAACVFFTKDSARTVLDSLHSIEVLMGRERLSRWGQRTLDLDLVGQGEAVLPDARTFDHWKNLPADEQARVAPDTLILPHPRVQDRSFVLVPLAEIAPDWIHPHLGLSVTQMLNARPAEERDTVVPILP